MTKMTSELSETFSSTVSPLHPNCNQYLVNPGEVWRICLNFEREMILLKKNRHFNLKTLWVYCVSYFELSKLYEIHPPTYLTVMTIDTIFEGFYICPLFNTSNPSPFPGEKNQSIT